MRTLAQGVSLALDAFEKAVLVFEMASFAFPFAASHSNSCCGFEVVVLMFEWSGARLSHEFTPKTWKDVEERILGSHLE